jgi:HEAT repeat protein
MMTDVADFRAELESLVRSAEVRLRAEIKASVNAVLTAGAGSHDDLGALLLDRAAGANRGHACRLLGLLGGETALSAFVAMLTDPEVTWRNAAVNALGLASRELPCAIPALIEIMQTDPDDNLRDRAALALGSCGTGSIAAVDALLAVLADRAERPALRGAAAEALDGYEDARVSSALIVALDEPEPEVRFFAAFALGARGETAALPSLARLAATEQAVIPNWGSVRDEVMSAIECIRGAQARALHES